MNEGGILVESVLKYQKYKKKNCVRIACKFFSVNLMLNRECCFTTCVNVVFITVAFLFQNQFYKVKKPKFLIKVFSHKQAESKLKTLLPVL